MTSSLNTPQPQSSKKDSSEWRCECGKLLFKGAFLAGLLEIKCSRCKRMVYLQQFNSSYTADNQSFMVTLDDSGTILTISKGVEGALQYPAKEVIGKCLADFIDSKYHGVIGFWIEKIKQNSGEGDPYTSLVLPLISRSGQEDIFSFLVRPIHLNNRDIYIAIAEESFGQADKNNNKTISKIAQKSKQKSRAWSFVINSKGIITEVSDIEGLGYQDESLINTSILDILISYDKSLMDKLARQEGFILPLTIRTKSSKSQEYDVCFTPDFLAGPKESAFIVALRPR